MTFKLIVEGWCGFRPREMGWKFSVGRRNSKEQNQDTVPIFRDIKKASLMRLKHREGRKLASVYLLTAENSMRCFTYVDSLINSPVK